MPPRKRHPGRGDLPPNLYPNGKYWQYKNPETGKKVSLNLPKDQAIEKAKKANAIIANRQIDRLIGKMSGNQPGIRMAKILEDFEREGLPRLGLAKSTTQEHCRRLRRYATDFGDRRYRDCDLEFWNAYLSQFPADHNAYVKHRGLLIHIYRYAISKGWERNSINFPELTLTGMKQEKKRRPLTSDQLNDIVNHESAEQWFTRIVQFDRKVLFRRSDLVKIKRSDVNIEKKSIQVEISKTLNYKTPIFMELELPDQAWEIARASLADRMHTPYLFWYSPRARNRAKLNNKPHWTYIMPDYVSKRFAAIRDATKLFNHLEPGERPTLSEVRGLGARELQESGVDPELIQTLMGHSRKTTTQLYLDNGEPVYNWVTLRAKA